MKSKEELQRDCAEASKALRAIEEAEAETKAKPLVGTYWKYRNCYSCPEKPSDYWWLYLAVVKTDGTGHLHTFKFETDKHGNVTTESREYVWPHSMTNDPYIRITKREFEAAWKKMVKHLEQSKP